MTDPREEPAEADRPLTRREAAEVRRQEAVAGAPDPVVPPVEAIPPRPDLPHDPAAVFHDSMRSARMEFEHQVARRREQIDQQVARTREQFGQANEKIKERTGRDLILAILIGVAIGVLLVATLVFLKWIFVVFAVAASVLGTIELTRAFQGGGRRVDLVPQLVVGTAVVLSGAVLGYALHWVMLFTAVVIIVIWRLIAQMAAKDGRIYADVVRDVVVGVFLQLYVPFLASLALVLLRQEQGEWWVLAFIIITVAVDTGAYAAGISFGRHPMAPRISPKKTWEGFGGGVVAAVGAGLLLAHFMLHLPLWTGAVLGILILVSATAGDLGESLLKRDLGIKDMSSWLPGHGGVLDRLDSILLSTVPALALYFLFSPLVVS